jgi:hypothetical protein
MNIWLILGAIAIICGAVFASIMYTGYREGKKDKDNRMDDLKKKGPDHA